MCHLNGIRFDNVTMPEAVAAIVGMAQKSVKPCLVCTANLSHMSTMEHDAEFRTIYREADFVVADGMPLVWMSRLAGTPLKERVTGSDLFWELGRVSARLGVRLFFLGGAPTNAERAALVLAEKFPGVNVVGTYCPPFGSLGDPKEEEKIASLILSAQPDVLLVGFGSPKQEKWIYKHRNIIRVPVSIGVGASFDMACGAVRRAPAWAQQSGFEWLFRLMQEPKRLWNRYIKSDLPFLPKLAAITLKSRFKKKMVSSMMVSSLLNTKTPRAQD